MYVDSSYKILPFGDPIDADALEFEIYQSDRATSELLGREDARLWKRRSMKGRWHHGGAPQPSTRSSRFICLLLLDAFRGLLMQKQTAEEIRSMKVASLV